MKKRYRKRILVLLAAAVLLSSFGGITAEALSMERVATNQEQNAEKLTAETVRQFMQEGASFMGPWFVGTCQYIDPAEYNFQMDLLDQSGNPISYPVKHDTIHTREQLKEATRQYVTESLAEEMLSAACAKDVDGALCVFPGLGVGGPAFSAKAEVYPKSESTNRYEIQISTKTEIDPDYGEPRAYDVVFEQGVLKLDGSVETARDFFYLAQPDRLWVEIVEEDPSKKQVDIEPKTILYGDGYTHGIADVWWGPGLFTEDAFTPNQPLAAVAAALNCAASDKDEEHRGTGRYLVPAYEALGFEQKNIALYGYPKNTLNHDVGAAGEKDDTFAFSIAFQRMGDMDLICLVLRGTETAAEMAGDAGTGSDNSSVDFYGENPYAFFLRFEKDVCEALDAFIKDHSKDLREGKVKFLIAGHGLGGAAANLLAAELNNEPRLGAQKKDIYAYTFGALNSIRRPAKRFDDYGNIYNFFNFYDSFGPQGEFWSDAKPAGGKNTVYNKFGTVVPFDVDFRQIFTKGDPLYQNHVCAAYFEAINAGWANMDETKCLYYRLHLSCPVDVEVYDQTSELICRITKNAVDEENCYIPAFISGENADEKELLIPVNGDEYTVLLYGTAEGTMDIFAEPWDSHYEEDGSFEEYSEIAVTAESQWELRVSGEGELSWVSNSVEESLRQEAEPKDDPNAARAKEILVGLLIGTGVFLFFVMVLVICILIRARSKREYVPKSPRSKRAKKPKKQ